MNGFVLTILSIAAVASASIDYELKCTREEMGILWPNYQSKSEYFMCRRVGAPQIKFTCPLGELFSFALQVCASPDRYIPPPPLAILPTSAPSNLIHTKPWIADQNVPQTKPYRPHHELPYHHQQQHHQNQQHHNGPHPQQHTMPKPYYPAELAVEVNAPVKPDKIERPSFLDLIAGVAPVHPVGEPEKPEHTETEHSSPPVLEEVKENVDFVAIPPNMPTESEHKPVMSMPSLKPVPAVQPPMPPTPEPTPPVVVTTPQDVATSPQAHATPPQASATPPQASATPPQASATPPSVKSPSKPSKPSKPTPKKPTQGPKQTTTKQPATPTKKRGLVKPTKAQA